jgi:hypothetical protein
MDLPNIGLLPPDLAAAADAVIGSVIEVAAREVTAVGSTIEAATRNAWAHVAADHPEVWALALLRLQETGNEEMLLLAELEEDA